MTNDSILQAIDEQIAKLTQARSLLSTGSTSNGSRSYTGARRGRKPGISLSASSAAPKTRKANMSVEGRKRIAEAMKKRWATRKANITAIKSTTPTTAKRVIGKPAVKNATK